MAYETVHHNSGMDAQLKRHRGLVQEYQQSEYKVQLSLGILNGAQNSLFVVGVLLMCLISAFDISNGRYPVAQFITVLTYLSQLQAPLGFFGSFYNLVQNSMVDAERMLTLVRPLSQRCTIRFHKEATS